MNYKKVIKSRKIRLKILRFFNFLPDKMMLKIQYFIKHKRKLNISPPKQFTEKIQYYKLYYRNKNMPNCVDKYNVRKYIKTKGLEDILIPLYGLYDNVNDIDFFDLPNQFVMKTTNGGGGINIIICKNKRELNINYVKETMKNWLQSKKVSGSREWVYSNLKPRIVVEEYLENHKQPEAGIIDYKFFCFNGVPEYVVVDIDRYTSHKRNFYDSNWNYINVSSDTPNFGDKMKKPEGLDEMLEVASILSNDFPFVRVDLYYVNKKIYFGEMTFFPWSGYVEFIPDRFDFILGSNFEIDSIKNIGDKK